MLKFLDAIAAKVKRAGGTVFDRAAKIHGYRAIPTPLDEGDGVRSFTLDMQGYRQVDTYSCGAVAGFMALKYLRPKKSFGAFYDRVEPGAEAGTSTTRLIRGLRKSGLRVSRRRDLDFDAVAAAIEHDECPIVVTVTIPRADYDHWVVVYGVGRRPKTMFVAGDGFPVFSKNEWTWADFRRRWSPRGEGLIAW